MILGRNKSSSIIIVEFQNLKKNPNVNDQQETFI